MKNLFLSPMYVCLFLKKKKKKKNHEEIVLFTDLYFNKYL